MSASNPAERINMFKSSNVVLAAAFATSFAGLASGQYTTHTTNGWSGWENHTTYYAQVEASPEADRNIAMYANGSGFTSVAPADLAVPDGRPGFFEMAYDPAAHTLTTTFSCNGATRTIEAVSTSLDPNAQDLLLKVRSDDPAAAQLRVDQIEVDGVPVGATLEPQESGWTFMHISGADLQDGFVLKARVTANYEAGEDNSLAFRVHQGVSQTLSQSSSISSVETD